MAAVDEAYEIPDPDEHWHARYVADNCARCPECCVKISNNNAWLAEGDVCLEENVDKIEAGWTKEQVYTWCQAGIDRSDEETYCGPDDCPGPCCPCVIGADGLWWLDYTGFGSDEGPCNRP